MKKILSDDLVCMNDYQDTHPIKIELVYALPDHPENMFGEAIYHENAKFWLHKELAQITLKAAEYAKARHGWTLILKDGLRTKDAQERIQNTAICQANPQWFEAPRMFSPPGAGGHPRGMAVDVDPEDHNGKLVDMGTAFDTMADNPAPEHNQSHRDYTGFSDEILENRKNLTACFVDAAKNLDLPIHPLSVEWWDFRFPHDYYNEYAPLSDTDLPPAMRMVKI